MSLKCLTPAHINDPQHILPKAVIRHDSVIGTTNFDCSKSHARRSNPLLTPLPHAPHMRIYCMYGVGIPTERAYHYTNRTAALNVNVNANVNPNPKPNLNSPTTYDRPEVNSSTKQNKTKQICV